MNPLGLRFTSTRLTVTSHAPGRDAGPSRASRFALASLAPGLPTLRFPNELGDEPDRLDYPRRFSLPLVAAILRRAAKSAARANLEIREDQQTGFKAARGSVAWCPCERRQAASCARASSLEPSAPSTTGKECPRRTGMPFAGAKGV